MAKRVASRAEKINAEMREHVALAVERGIAKRYETTGPTEPVEIKLLPSEAQHLFNLLDEALVEGTATVREYERTQLKWIREQLARTVTGNPLLRIDY